MDKIKEDLKSGKFKNVYLLYGEEKFLIKQYRDKLYKAIIPPGGEAFNYSFFEGKSVETSALEDACETLPFMNEKRLVIAKNTELFVAGKKDESEKMAGYIENISDSCVLIFIEEKADKRGRLYKTVSKKGHCAEFKLLKEKELTLFANNLFKAEGIPVDSQTTVYFVRCIGTDMNSLVKEAEKLFSYKKKGDRLTREDIDLVCTKSLEAVVFDLVAAIGEKKADKAIEIYNRLIMMKESPFGILVMIARQFRMIIQCKYLLKEGMSVDNICSLLGIRGFMAREYIKESQNFSNKVLLNAIKDCLECDVNIKTGKISDKLGVEMIIFKYSG